MRAPLATAAVACGVLATRVAALALVVGNAVVITVGVDGLTMTTDSGPLNCAAPDPHRQTESRTEASDDTVLQPMVASVGDQESSVCCDRDTSWNIKLWQAATL